MRSWPVRSLPAEGEEGATSVLDSALTRGQSAIGRRTSIFPRISAACCQVTHSNRWASLVPGGVNRVNLLEWLHYAECFVLIAMRRNAIGPSVAASQRHPQRCVPNSHLLPTLSASPKPLHQTNTRGCASCYAALSTLLSTALACALLIAPPSKRLPPSGRAASSHSARGTALAIRSAGAFHDNC